jgi:hypothetical protein
MHGSGGKVGSEFTDIGGNELKLLLEWSLSLGLSEFGHDLSERTVVSNHEDEHLSGSSHNLSS